MCTLKSAFGGQIYHSCNLETQELGSLLLASCWRGEGVVCFLASPSRPAVLQKAIGSCRTHHCSLKTQSTANLVCRKTLPEPAVVGLKHLLGWASLPAWHCVPVHYMEENWIPCQRP